MTFSAEIDDVARRAGTLLRASGDTVAVAEGSAGGLISAALLSIRGASAYYLGGTVIYTAAAGRAWMAGAVDVPPGMRGASEPFASYLAASVRRKVEATWGIGEAGAAGPANPYGDPAGHTWMAIDGPRSATRHLLTGIDDRAENMQLFAVATLELLCEVMDAP